MTTWNDFTAAEPEMAERAKALFGATTNTVLATIRRDGSPRVSGIDPFFFDGNLWMGSMPDARKGADLRRDPRMALHCIPWESRRVRDGADDPGDGDAKLTGRGFPVTDPAMQEAVVAWFKEEHGVEPPGPADWFIVEVDSVVLISVDGEELVIDRWSPTNGRTTTRRT